MHTTLYTNGLLYLGEGRFSRGALLTRGDRIAAVMAEGVPLPGAHETVDLAGGTLLPGFQDAHVHPLLAGLQLLSIDLHTVHDRSEYLRLIGDYAAAHPHLPVLSGGGWFGDAFPGGFPTAAELDEVVPDRPVVLHSHDAHGAWVNSAALRAAGIDASTPDPIGGRILRNADGSPTGMLLEAATAPATALVAAPDPAMLTRALCAAQERLHAAGITAWQDAAVGPSDLGPDALPVYEHLEREGLLTARVVLALWWDRDRGDEQIAELVATRERLRLSSRLDAGTVKVMIDGMIENHTAAMLEPFTGHADDRGIRFIEPAALAELTVALDAAGFQIHFHAVGDAAVRDALDALEVARRHNGPSSNRHHIAHLDLVHPSDAPRLRELDATANVTALWARRDDEIITRKLPLLGERREAHHFPFGTLRRHGARIVGGSDWPVTAPDPLWAVKTAVTRTGVAEDPHAIGSEVLTAPLLADEALPLGVALDAYLAEAAFINRLDGETGTLRVGAAADLVWVDRDLRRIDELGSAVVMRTVVGGELVYRAD